MNTHVQTPHKQRAEYLSSTGMERTVFVLFCAIAMLALLMTTILGTEPAPESESDFSYGSGILSPSQPADEAAPQSDVGGFPAANSPD